MNGKIMFTLAEDKEKSTDTSFSTIYKVDQEDYLHFTKGLVTLGYDVYFVNWADFDGLEFSRVFNYNSQKFVKESIDSMDLIFVYKQEGFLKNLDRFFGMLKRFEESGAIIRNHPETIRKNISKDYLFDLQKASISVIPTYELTEEIIGRIKSGEKFVIKPRVGERGLDQALVSNEVALQPFLKNPSEYLAQEFCESIREGEISLAFVGKEFSHALIKWPNKDNPEEYRCNESRGGSWARHEPTEKEMDYALLILDFWESMGCPVSFSRIDIVNVNGEPTLVEAELLNPSVSANYLEVGESFGNLVAKHFDDLIKSRATPTVPHENHN